MPLKRQTERDCAWMCQNRFKAIIIISWCLGLSQSGKKCYSWNSPINCRRSVPHLVLQAAFATRDCDVFGRRVTIMMVVVSCSRDIKMNGWRVKYHYAETARAAFEIAKKCYGIWYMDRIREPDAVCKPRTGFNGHHELELVLALTFCKTEIDGLETSVNNGWVEKELSRPGMMVTAVRFSRIKSWRSSTFLLSILIDHGDQVKMLDFPSHIKNSARFAHLACFPAQVGQQKLKGQPHTTHWRSTAYSESLLLICSEIGVRHSFFPGSLRLRRRAVNTYPQSNSYRWSGQDRAQNILDMFRPPFHHSVAVWLKSLCYIAIDGIF